MRTVKLAIKLQLSKPGIMIDVQSRISITDLNVSLSPSSSVDQAGCPLLFKRIPPHVHVLHAIFGVGVGIQSIQLFKFAKLHQG